MPGGAVTGEETRGTWRALAALCAAIVIVALLYLAQSRRTNVIFDSPSDFGRVRVVERHDGLRYLVTGEGRARQSAIYPGRPLHLELAYTRVAAIALALTPPDGRLLFVGLGGGAMPMHARQVLPQAHIDVVEIDPVIVDAAQRFFGFTPDARLRVHTGDGRAFIERSAPGSYDVIVLDAFSDDEVPFALTTRQFLEAVHEALAPGGAVVSNLWTANRDYDSMLATYDAVFDQLALLRVPGRSQNILIAGPPDRRLGQSDLVHAARALEARSDPGFDLVALVDQGFHEAPRIYAPPLEDREPRGTAPSAAPRSRAIRPPSLASTR